MRRWDFWGWIAYGSIALAAFIEALSEGFKRAELGQMPTDLPAFFTSSNWAFVPLALVAFGTVIFLAKEIGWIKPRRYAGETDLQVQINASNLAVQHLNAHNIQTWYFLHHSFRTQDISGRVLSIERQWTAYLTFKEPANIHQIIIEGGAQNLPVYEVKQVTAFNTVILFQGDIAGMTITIRAINN